MATPSLIAFGSIAPWPSSDWLEQIRRSLLQQPSQFSIAKAIGELPALWSDLIAYDPDLKETDGKDAANDLAEWIHGTLSSKSLRNRGNVSQMPLTTLAQIVLYHNYLRQTEQLHEDILKSVSASGGVQGFCIGLLNALAVASSTTEDGIGMSAATSLRLAFCIGLYVDLDQRQSRSDSRAMTFAVRWKEPATLEDIDNLLSKYEDTYISVVRDVRDATITTPASKVEVLLNDFAKTGASLLDTRVSGRYHAAIHKGKAQRILDVCHAEFQPESTGSQVRSNTDSNTFKDSDCALKALRCILEERANWYSTISTAAASLKQHGSNPFILSVGQNSIPHSIARALPVVKAAMVSAVDDAIVETPFDAPAKSPGDYPSDAIAIIGMAGRFPGADTLDEYWNLLLEGKSMLSEAPEARFGKTARTKAGQRFWGNFLQDVEGFDHGFFKRSPREAQSMDPQQRLLLELAYESLEFSGYFSASNRPEDVGVFIGACATDYDFNVASHAANAYSATGTLRSFLSGKISHYFGWDGPSLVIDTACSSSAVAIHTACTALKTGQCSQALAGGVTLMTSPYLYENFNAAHFLTPTGASKAFSSDADGYCRGEGGALVVLKRLTDALQDNDNILGVIAGSAVNQNDNCVPITVPHTKSQGTLYEKVCRQAGVTKNDINFVEAHGTGTPVGDPIEMESIRRVFGGPDRDAPLIVSSTKGNIGHLEGASGVAALIKSILQMQKRVATKQASHKSLNPKIPALEPDNICIPRTNVALPPKERLAACVNNYGAAGSNAAMIVFESPQRATRDQSHLQSAIPKVPVQIAAATAKSLLSYCNNLADFCTKLSRETLTPQKSLANLAFSLSKRLNQDLPYQVSLSTSSLDDLRSQLGQLTDSAIKERSSSSPPAILCFGGQVSDRASIDRALWEQSALLRAHLDACDSATRSLGYPSIYPGIFSSDPVADVVALHSRILAIQYATAKAWIDVGLKPAALVGHSFGQLTALCVSGVLSLEDGVKLIVGRAALMREYWGPERGSMIAVQADRETLENVRVSLPRSHSFEIACFNGPTSHTLVSDKASCDAVVALLSERAIKHRKLDVPFGFHSVFTEPLLQQLHDLASSVTIKEVQIPVETCSNGATWSKVTPELLAAHTREPVFFGQAVYRLQQRLGPCTWLEAGSGSGVTSMAKAVVGSTTGNAFVPIQFDKSTAAASLTDATASLWNAGQKVQYWNFHPLQAVGYERLYLPPYSWEKSNHWLDLKMDEALSSDTKAAGPAPIATQTVQAAPNPPAFALPSVHVRMDFPGSVGYSFTINPSGEQLAPQANPAPYPAARPIEAAPVTDNNLNRQMTAASVASSNEVVKPVGKDARTSVFDDVCVLLEQLADIPANKISPDASFDDIGVDSLMVIEVISELQTMFKVDMPVEELEQLTDLNSLVEYLLSKGAVGSGYDSNASRASSARSSSPSTGASTSLETPGSEMTTPPFSPKITAKLGDLDLGPAGLQKVFNDLRFDWEKHAAGTGASDFWTKVYPDQAEVVCAYILDAYRELGVDLSIMSPGEEIPWLDKALPKHKYLLAQLQNLLVDSELLELSGMGDNKKFVRSSKPVNPTATQTLYEQLLQKHPDYAWDTKCLQITAPVLAECLVGKKDPLNLLFGNRGNRDALADFYAKSPLLDATCRLLAEFVSTLPSVAQSQGPLRILEVGAGTGGTTKYLTQLLTSRGIHFEYTFTDLSQALVNQAKKTFAGRDNMKFQTFNADKPAPEELRNQYHLVLSTNCIHATSSIERSTRNILPVLRDDGALCVLEFTRNLGWFDLVFGLLEGWWLMEDSRTHALASESFWDSSLRAAGYKHVSWTTGQSEEANTLRLICGFKQEIAEDSGSVCDEALAPISPVIKRAGIPMQEVPFKKVGDLELKMDVYFPKNPDAPGKTRPVALLLHGGGHMLFGRKDVPMKHIRKLLERGFLPVVNDYRLVPETNLFDGPMTDCCDALQWVKEVLPSLRLSGPSVRPDGSQVVAFGWSSGGQLAMSLGYTAPARGIKAPDAIFGLYSPSDMESDHWHKPCYPLAAEEEVQEITDILAGVQESPILEYAPLTEKRTMALSLTLKDPRAKIILHTCWNSMTLPILVNGLPHKDSERAKDGADWRYPPAPTEEQVHKISPLWHIRQGTYKTPTFLVHGNADDWLPLEMSQRTFHELQARGIPCAFSAPEQCTHAFDLFPVGDPLGVGWKAIDEGYEFIRSLGLGD